MNKQNQRPKIHFTPPSGWLNDPNGMVYVDGTYHLFYQHCPHSMEWGPMHWGHAISKDLLNWEHMPVALYPDQLGEIFSGSCVYDASNTSGFGKEGKPPMVAIFTSHSKNTPPEVQSIAYSTDYSHFEKYYGNPVIVEPDLKDFRDPKAFWNPIRNCWSLVLAAADRVSFYCSDDLKQWTKTGDFTIGHNGLNGICECPDCFTVKTDDGEKWVLVISMIIPTDDKRKAIHKTQYFIGQFDGDTFIETEKYDYPLWMNYGPDHYAGVIFQNLDKPVMMAWASNWAYAHETPANEYRGQMSLATEIKLKKTTLGYRAAMEPLGLEQFRSKSSPISSKVRLESDTYGLKINGKNCGKITLSNDLGEKLLVEMTDDEIIVARTNTDKKDFHPFYNTHSNVTVNRFSKGDFSLELIYDVSVLEVFADDGLIPITMSVYPQKPFDILESDGNLGMELFYFE